MKCDSEPCKNGGVCTEDFTNQESSCDCELTSYFGEYCMEEKGADFNGESILQRKFVLNEVITKVSKNKKGVNEKCVINKIIQRPSRNI